jgi:hypothetical protein
MVPKRRSEVCLLVKQLRDQLTTTKKQHNIGNQVLSTILFAADQAIFSESKTTFKIAVNRLGKISNGFNARISNKKTITMAFRRKPI